LYVYVYTSVNLCVGGALLQTKLPTFVCGLAALHVAQKFYGVAYCSINIYANR